ncbi:unnamed protein product, partial [Rotaria magnacalcarata]
MTTMICFSIIISALVSSLIAQYPYFHNPSWNDTSRQSFMGPVELYVGVNVPKTNHPTAPPIDVGLPIDNNNNHEYKNKLFTTRTTYFFHPMSTTTIQTKRYYHYRRRNRTQTI